jgi:hypothetical protein
MTLRKVVVCIVATFTVGFFVGELVSVPHARAQPRFQIYVQGVGDPHQQNPVNLKGSKVVGFSCADGTCYVATE